MDEGSMTQCKLAEALRHSGVVVATARWRGRAKATGEALLAPARNRRSRVGRIRFITRIAVELASRDDEVGEIVAEAQREVAHLFGVLIERGRRDGEIAGAVDPVQTGHALLRLCIGVGVIGTPPVDLLQQSRALLPASPKARA